MLGAYYRRTSDYLKAEEKEKTLRCVGIHPNGLHLMLVSDGPFSGYGGKRMSLAKYNELKEKMPRSFTTNRYWVYEHPSNVILVGTHIADEARAALEDELTQLGNEARQVLILANALTTNS